MGDLANFYNKFYEREKQNRNDNFANVLNLSRQIGVYRTLLSNLLVDIEDESTYISNKKERVRIKMAELEKEFNEIFMADGTKNNLL